MLTHAGMRLTAILLFTLLFLSPPPAQAHPHVFIDTTLSFTADATGLRSIHQYWLFDDMFTQAILTDLGIKPEELSTVEGQTKFRDGAFNNLRNFDYYTAVHVNGQKYGLPAATNFKASLKDNRLVYEFDLPVDIQTLRTTVVRVASFDKEYYCDVLLQDKDIALQSSGGTALSFELKPAEDLAYWAGFQIPKGINLKLVPPGADPNASPSAAPGSLESAREQVAKLMPHAPAPPQPTAWQKAMRQFMGKVVSIQKIMKKRLTALGGKIAGNPFGSEFWLFVLLSFGYGVIHAIGPGHGKTVVCSYFLARPGSMFLGALMANVLTFVHMGSAVVTVGLAWLFLGSGMGGFQQAAVYIQPASYALLGVVGLGLAFKIISDLRKGGLVRADGPDEEACSCESFLRESDTRNALVVSFATGLVPCPGAAVILAFALGMGIFAAGVASMIAMALGMGLTTTLFAWAAVGARGALFKLSARNKRLLNAVYGLLSIGGALAITAFGAVMLMGSVAGL